MDKPTWKFTEDQRDEVCKGQMCPQCLGREVEHTGSVPDGINQNNAYKCKECDEVWEGY